jgi:hypothetical protein
MVNPSSVIRRRRQAANRFEMGRFRGSAPAEVHGSGDSRGDSTIVSPVPLPDKVADSEPYLPIRQGQIDLQFGVRVGWPGVGVLVNHQVEIAGLQIPTLDGESPYLPEPVGCQFFVKQAKRSRAGAPFLDNQMLHAEPLKEFVDVLAALHPAAEALRSHFTRRQQFVRTEHDEPARGIVLADEEHEVACVKGAVEQDHRLLTFGGDKLGG